MPLTNPSNASNLGFTPGGTIASDKVQAAVLEAAAEALQKANNLSDLASVSAAWSNLGAAQSLAANGWVKLPNGLILQWRTLLPSAQTFNANTYYSFPIVFPISFNTVYSCVGSQILGLMPSSVGATFANLSNSQVEATVLYTQTLTSFSVGFRIFAIGI